MKLFLSIALIFSISVSNAQSTQENRVIDQQALRNTNIRQMGVWVKNTPASEIKGSHYLFDSWNNDARLYVTNGTVVYNIKDFNYNIKNQRFEAKLSEDSVLIMNTSNIKKITIRDKTFNRFELEDNTSNPFFEIIGTEDNSILLKKYNVIVKQGSLNPMTQQTIRPSEYVIRDEYFTANLDGTNVNEIKLKKSTILKMFNKGKKEKVEEFADENDLNFKDDQDVHKIFLYSNTL